MLLNIFKLTHRGVAHSTPFPRPSRSTFTAFPQPSRSTFTPFPQPSHCRFLSSISMDDSSDTRGPHVQTEKESSDEVNVDRKGGPLSDNIIPHILNLYNCTSSGLDYEIYAPNGTFEDPLMCAHGVKQIKSAFYSIPKVFSEAKMGEYTVHENVTGPGTGEINIDNVQHYKILGRKIDMVSLIKLQVKDGKVVRHEDLWDKKPLWSRTTIKVPLVGRLAESVRRGNMMITHALMGFGKDPKPKTQ